jgi:hypothetical protein
MITARDFHTAWCASAKEKETEIKSGWNSPSDYTSTIMYESSSVISLVCEKLNLKHYAEYYCIDNVLYKPEDLVPGSPKNTTWLRKIRVAFEHENYFNSGLFQEISHLLITQCELRVLVSYPDSINEIQPELNYLHTVISGTDTAREISDKGGLLFIIGWRHKTEGHDEVFWFGYLYQTSGWVLLPMANTITNIETALQKAGLPLTPSGSAPVLHS